MGSLSDSGISGGLTIDPDHIGNVYDTLTGQTAYDNIGLAEFTYLNAGGTFGSGGYGIRKDGLKIQVKHSGGSWSDIGTSAGEANEYSFKTISVSGQSNVVADTTTDTLTFVASTGMTLTTSGDTVTFESSAGGGAGTVTTDLNQIAFGTATDTVGGDDDFAYTAGVAGMIIDFDNSTGDIELQSAGFSTFGDFNGQFNGTYIYVDDGAETIRIQSEGEAYFGDSDWVGGDNIALFYSASLIGIQGDASLISTDCYFGTQGELTFSASDKRLKKNIVQIDNAVKKVTQLSGVYFDWKTKEEGNFHSPIEGRKLGFIAQEVGKVVPELMNEIPCNSRNMTNPSSILFKEKYMYGVHEKDISALLVEAIKEQQVQIDKQQKMIEELQAKIL